MNINNTAMCMTVTQSPLQYITDDWRDSIYILSDLISDEAEFVSCYRPSMKLNLLVCTNCMHIVN